MHSGSSKERLGPEDSYTAPSHKGSAAAQAPLNELPCSSTASAAVSYSSSLMVLPVHKDCWDAGGSRDTKTDIQWAEVQSNEVNEQCLLKQISLQ